MAQGLQFTESFYWDMNDDTRAWTKRFVPRMNGRLYPTMNHAGNYGGMLHYLKAVDAAQTTDGVKVVAKMKELPTMDRPSARDACAKTGGIFTRCICGR